MSKYGPTFWRDFAERVIASYVGAFIAAMAVSPATDVGALKATAYAAAFAALPAGFSAAKAFVAERIPGTVSPASLAPR
jgi:glycerol uptake facilitator-like aquaporin